MLSHDPGAGGMSYAAVLSDLDGVLVDSGASIEETWRAWARSHGLDPDFAPHVHGVPSRDVIARVAPHLDADLESAIVERMEIANPAGTALAGAAELLGGGAGLPVAIVTSCTDALARARLDAAGLPVPAVLVTVDRVRAGKPDPEGYLLAAAELGVAPGSCVVLEDAPAGVAAGRAAGATVIAITTTHTPSQLSGAHALAGSFAEALARAAIA
jgi:mannitol-1-/sugar-/sorbitol-6-phosphatase